MPDNTFNVPVTVTDQRISDLLCNALEGGSNYWYTITAYTKPTEMVFQCMADTLPTQIFKHIDYPMNPGGSITIGDREDGRPHGAVFINSVITKEVLLQGLRVMSEKYPRHFADFIAENDDAETGDVFLQCCCFGEIVYG